MKKFKLNIFLMLMFVMSSIGTFAQNPGDFDDPADTNPTDAPIGDYLWVVGILGLLFVFFKVFNSKQQKAV